MNVIVVNLVLNNHLNGVNVYVENLLEKLQEREDCNITLIQFSDKVEENKIYISEELKPHKTITIGVKMAFFQCSSEELKPKLEEVYGYIKDILPTNGIIHNHMLDLHLFAEMIKQNGNFKLITHLHCISWKILYEVNQDKFNELYETYYINKDYDTFREWSKQTNEYSIFKDSDKVIAVTQNGANFVKNICPEANVEVIYNGLKVTESSRQYFEKGTDVTLINVSNNNRSKGLENILAGLSLLTDYNLKLIVCGTYHPDRIQEYKTKYPNVNVEFKGGCTAEEVKELYNTADIGIIGSVAEQCSYVALEMMREGLPIVTTDADGLKELLTNGYNCIKIPVEYIKGIGLTVNSKNIAYSVEQYLRNPFYAKHLGRNARNAFDICFNEDVIFNATFKIYDKFQEEIENIEKTSKEDKIEVIESNKQVEFEDFELPVICKDDLGKPLRLYDKVLARDGDNHIWKADIIKGVQYENTKYKYKCLSDSFKQCVKLTKETIKLFNISDALDSVES